MCKISFDLPGFAHFAHALATSLHPLYLENLPVILLSYKNFLNFQPLFHL